MLTNNKNSSQNFLLEENSKLHKKLDDFLTIAQNTTDQLTISEQRFRLALRGANDGLWDWNLESDEVYFSPRWKSMLGYQEDELDNNLETFTSLVHPDEIHDVLEKVQQYLTGESDSYEVEVQMQHKTGHYIFVLSRGFAEYSSSNDTPIRLVGTHVDITARKNAEDFNERTSNILRMVAMGKPAKKVYDAIALLYESRHPGLRCSLLELENGVLLHGGAPSMPQEYCDAVHGLKNGPNVGSCGASTYTGNRCLVENIETHSNWAEIKEAALPHGMRCCWSEPIKDSSGRVLGAFGMYYDYPALPNEKESNDLTSAARLAGIVMERDQNQKRIHELAYTDTLTGIASRAHFYQYLEDLIKTSGQHQHSFSLLYIDLDDFKSVNDSLGHDVGDLLLKTIAKRLETVGRLSDFVSRLSGDEFSIIVRDVDEDFDAVYVAKRCLDIISEPVELCGRQFSPACSIGIARYPEDGVDLSTLVKAADTSLYAAKDHGKNQYAFYKPELAEKADYRFKIEQSLRRAIENHELTLVYQPQVKIDTLEIMGVEVLSRWHDPQLGTIHPIEFIATAERIGMIKQYTKWVLRTACQQAVAWKKAGHSSLRMSVNISPNHFLDEDFVPFVKQVIDETGMDPANLELEVTENVVQINPLNLPNFKKLRDLKVLIAIDDFGTGYSSFASLKHLKANCLKIDQYFIKDLASDDKTKHLVNSMIEIGHNLEHGIIAEGIENVEQLNALKKLDCDSGQGFLFSKPVNEEAMELLLRDGINL